MSGRKKQGHINTEQKNNVWFTSFMNANYIVSMAWNLFFCSIENQVLHCVNLWMENQNVTFKLLNFYPTWYLWGQNTNLGTYPKGTLLPLQINTVEFRPHGKTVHCTIFTLSSTGGSRIKLILGNWKYRVKWNRVDQGQF